MKRSITMRLTAMFAVTTLVTFSLMGGAMYEVLNGELFRHQKEELATSFQGMRYQMARVGDAEHWAHARTKMDTLTPADGTLRFWVLSSDPQYRYGSDAAAVFNVRLEKTGLGTAYLPGKPYPFRVVAGAIGPYRERPAVTLVVGMDTASYAHTRHTFLFALIGLSFFSVALVSLLGYWIAGVGLKPLKQLSEEAGRLGPKTLPQRLRLPAMPSELADLTAAFNGALDRLESAYMQLEAFNADVAHELRTPLANLIGQTQVALSRHRTAPQFEDVLQSNLEELERLRAIVNDMLFLARADRGEAATGLVRSCIAEEAAKTVDFFEFLLDEARKTVRLDGDLSAAALIDTSLFRRALANLLQNAIQHSPPGAELTVRIDSEADAVRIAVVNPGDAIEAAHLPRLFDRFYRVDLARHDRGEHRGHGLGLAIVKAIATMHGGTVFAFSGEGNTTIGFGVRAPADSGIAMQAAGMTSD